MKAHLHGKEIKIALWQLIALIVINIPIRAIGRPAIQPAWTYTVVGPDKRFMA